MTTARGHVPSKSIADLYALQRTFSVETARQIANRVGLPARLDPDEHNPDIAAAPDDMLFAQLAWRLNSAAGRWAWNERLQTSSNPRMRAELARKVAVRTAAVLTLLRGPNGDLLESLGAGGLWAQAASEGAESGHEAVAESIAALDNLQRWASAMADRDASGIRDESVARRRPDEAFAALIGELGGIFFMFWRHFPGLSRPDQVSPDGPFFRFVAGVMDELDVRKSDEALATAIARHPILKALRAMGE